MGRGEQRAAGGHWPRVFAHLAIVIVFVLSALGYAPLRDPPRPEGVAIDHEAARAAVRPLPGVKSATWHDQANLAVRVDDANLGLATIDRVCDALSPLGDTLAVVVNVQDMTAQHADSATTLSRNCQLLEGQRAYLQRKRQVDVVAPEVRARFKAQQANK